MKGTWNEWVILFVFGLGLGILSSWAIKGFRPAEAVVKAPPLVVMEPGENTYRILMPDTVEFGRRIFVHGISLDSTWDKVDGIEQVVESVVFPQIFKGKIEVTIRHIPGPKN